MKYLANRTRQNRQNPPLGMNIFSKCLESGVTKPTKLIYHAFAQCKIAELALAGYKSKGAYSPLRAFFVRNISMRPHRYVELGRDIFGCAGFLLCQSANPFQLHTNHLAVICEAPKTKGAHYHV